MLKIFFIGVLMVLVVLGTALFITLGLVASTQRMTNEAGVQVDALHRLERNLREAENSSRAFRLTRDTRFRNRYQALREEMMEIRKSLTPYMQKHLEQSVRIADYNRGLDAYLHELDSASALRNDPTGPTEVPVYEETGQTERDMLEAGIVNMTDAEYRRINEWNAEGAKRMNMAYGLLGAILTLSLGGLVYFYYRIRRSGPAQNKA